MTLEEILDSVLLESGMDTETSYVGNSKDAVVRLVNLANRSIANLSVWPWQALRRTWSFTLSDDTQYTLPTDFGSFIPDTMYNSNYLGTVNFPTDASDWHFLQSSSGGTGSRVRARFIGDVVEIYEPTSGDTMRVEYRSKYPVLDSGGTAKQRFTVDSDTSRINDDLLTQDIIWRYKKLIGLDYQADLMECKSLEQTLKGQDGAAQTITPGQSAEFDGPYYNLWRP